MKAGYNLFTINSKNSNYQKYDSLCTKRNINQINFEFS